MTVPPLRLLCDVLLDLAEVRRIWAQRQPLDVSERLCRLASKLAGIAAITMLDLGDHRLARSLFRTARTAADETGDRHLRAWVAVRESLVPLYFGDPREAADLAAAAADLAGRQPCAAAVMAPVVRARAQARLIPPGHSGRRTALERARASLDRALDALTDLPADQRADTALGYTERQLHFHAGDILVALGDWQAAHRAFGRADEQYASTEVLDRTLVVFGQAQCLLAADEPDQALALGRDVLTGLPAEHRTAVIVQVARSFGRDVARRDGRLPALAGYREALRSA
jgi:tetratricopeptide (TPR) repeat protein